MWRKEDGVDGASGQFHGRLAHEGVKFTKTPGKAFIL
jgi:hypothetical protein